MTILWPFFPFFQEAGIISRGPADRRPGDHRVAASLQEGVIGRADVAEVAAVEDHLDVLVLGRQRRRIAGVPSVEALSMKMCS